MKQKGNIIIVSAPSGCGKTTITNKILKTVKGVKRSISVTTRTPRGGETKKKDYYFISEQSFKNKAKRGEFLEWVKNFGYYYGTPKKKLFDQLKSGNDVLLTIDVKGAAQVIKKLNDSVSVFIAPPVFEDLAKRLKKRATDGAKEVRKRLAIARKEMAFSKKYDYIIVNDKVADAVEKLKAIIIAKRCERDRYEKG